MGCGIDLSDFDDPVAALLAINDDIGHLDRELTAASLRPPALMVTCSSTHPDIEDFIVAKEGADFGSWVANISVRVADEASWMRLRSTLAASAHYNGEPGVLFADTADADNPTPELPTTSTAPCAEVFLAPGERCVFVTVNLAAHVVDGWFDWAAFRASVRLAVRTGDAAVELAALDASEVVAQRRRIGVGVCGFHTALIELGIPYARSIDFAARISETLTYTAHDASAALAIARGPFPSWAGSRWQDRSWLTRKADRRVGAVPETTWDSLHERIGTTGIRNAAVVAYPPTGVIANLLGVSRSYEPHYSLVGHTGVVSAERGGARIVPEVADLLTGSGGLHVRDAILGDGDGQLPGAGAEHLLACARQLPATDHLGVHAAFSGLADESGSKTVNLPGDVSVAEVEALLEEVRRLGLKGVSVFRDGSLDRPSKIRGVA
jgi:ribonucleoside-diphosphate reductase alpha chain